MISKLQLTNFAAFKKLELSFSPKINVIIGENSCGKTQILKSAYALSTPSENLNDRILGLFKPHKAAISGLYYRAGEGDAQLMIEDENDHKSEINFSPKSKNLQGASSIQGKASAILIPTKETLSLLPAIHNQDVDTKAMAALFDASVIELCDLLLKEPVESIKDAINSDPRMATIAPMLAKAIGGKFVIEKDDQYFVKGEYLEHRPSGSSKSKQAQVYADFTSLIFNKNDGTETSVTMTAEGYRKIGLLQRLLENGSLAQGGTKTILWDEPESNMNPGLIRMLVECLLTLSRNGQQIIIATHNYVLLKWFDLLIDPKQGDHITYHALYRDQHRDIRCETNDDYKMLSENAIADTYSNLYDAEIDRSLGGAK